MDIPDANKEVKEINLPENSEVTHFEKPAQKPKVVNEANSSNNPGEIKINIKLDELKKVIEENEDVPNHQIMMEAGDAEKVYKTLRDKYPDLPEFSVIDCEFEISALEVSKYYIRNIRRRLIEKTDFFAKILECYISGEPNMAIAIETQSLSDQDLELMNTIYNALNYYEKYSLDIALGQDEKQEAEFIVELFNEWIRLKPKLRQLVQKLKLSWKKELTKAKKEKYFN